MAQDFKAQVEHLKRQIALLREELRSADRRGERGRAVDILARMLSLQSAFFNKWRGSGQSTDLAEAGDADHPSRL